MTRSGWLWHLTDPAARAALGRRVEATTEEAFQVLRWSVMVGFAQFMAVSFPGMLYSAVYWGLAALLFAYLASRFLLRPEIRLFGPTASRTQRLVQTAFNFFICVLAFAVVLWLVNALVGAAGALRGVQGPALR